MSEKEMTCWRLPFPSQSELLEILSNSDWQKKSILEKGRFFGHINGCVEPKKGQKVRILIGPNVWS